ncbi:MAG: ribonuclease R family protein, partial [Vicinamibacteria bacterium]
EERVTVPPPARGGAADGDIVVVEIAGPLREAGDVVGAVAEILGRAESAGIEERILSARHGLPEMFPEDAVAEAERIPSSVSASLGRDREDLRKIPTVTIDGETARDFDDAVSIAREGVGGYRLWVSIADVAHYVRDGGALDREAFRRGTSVYFPGRAIPMLPEKLSNGVCSLNPGEDRLAMTADLRFDRLGRRREASFYPSVIRSAERMTYTAVGGILEKRDPELRRRYASLVASFEVMAELAARLRENRMANGSLDFDLPEAEIRFDTQGFPNEIVRAPRNVSHRIIEDFMLAANQAVAEFLTERGWPMLYRIHEPPERKDVEALASFLGSIGHPFDPRHEVKPLALSRVLDRVRGRP